MPNLSPDGLRGHIKAGKLAPIYVLSGEDVKLVEGLVDAIEATVDEADRPFAVERLYAGEEGGAPIDIAAAARILPMLGDRRIVFVMRAERLLKPKRASSAAKEEDEEPEAEGAVEEGAVDFTPLEDYLERPVPSSTLVFVASDVDRGRRFTKKLVQVAQFVEFGGIGGYTAAERRDAKDAAFAIVQKEIAMAGRKIEPDAVKLLVERAGGDVSKLRGDVERLLLYTEGRPLIAAADVLEVASEGAVEDDWAMVNAIGNGNLGLALRETARRFDRGDSAHGLIGQLRWWVSTRLAQDAPGRVRPALDALLRADLALKSSRGNDRLLVERLVMDLCGRPATPRPSR